MKRTWLLVAIAMLSACGTPTRVIVAAGTTLVDSGVLDELVSRYEAEYPDVELSVVGEATAQVIELGRRGGADVLFTHAPDLEAEFEADGMASRYEPVMEGRFALAGPADVVSEMPSDVDEAFREIARRGARFVSRSDGSGTYQKERELWTRAGVDPDAMAWYIETGQGMGLTLQVADQRQAFVLTELGAFVAAAPVLSLELVQLAVNPVLVNPYHITVVGDSPVEPGADAFASWLVSREGRQAIISVNNELFGRVVYQPVGP